jgi:FtsZ-binding cell division protein ZapB
MDTRGTRLRKSINSGQALAGSHTKNVHLWIHAGVLAIKQIKGIIALYCYVNRIVLFFVSIGVIAMTEENELARIERFVSTLLEKFNALQAENKVLDERLLEREITIETLQEELASMKNERGDISSRVSSLIGKIEEWESASGVSPESDESADNSSDSGVQGNLFSAGSPQGTQ